MDATGFVLVGCPFWYSLQCLVTVPAAFWGTHIDLCKHTPSGCVPPCQNKASELGAHMPRGYMCMASSSGLNNVAMISVPLILDLELVQLKSQNL